MDSETHHNSLNNLALQTLGQVEILQFQNGENIKYFKNPVILNKKYQSDIVPGEYEGGFQLWQCEIQFLKKIFEIPSIKQEFANKDVIQIGCGHGLLAIAAAKLGAKKITAQDFNFNVIEELTKPTVAINDLKSSINFLWGDWNSFASQTKYDLILGSELTYRQENYQKIITFVQNNMKKTGKCLLANKFYYFGVGGNLTDFKIKVEQKGLEWKSVLKIIPKSGGNKKEIIELTFKQ